eukprot:scaffold3289_cov362-Prasinococcus_capsulatus_cf.AAC.4
MPQDWAALGVNVKLARVHEDAWRRSSIAGIVDPLPHGIRSYQQQRMGSSLLCTRTKQSRQPTAMVAMLMGDPHTLEALA